MTPQDPQSNADKFDRLIANRSEIAEFINSFESERVQRKAFDALALSLGLTAADSAVVPPVERLHIVKDEPIAERDDSVDVDAGEPGDDEPGSATPRRRKARAASKKSFNVERGLVFAPDGHPTFENFVADKAPKTHDEKYLVACFYLQHMMGVEKVSIPHILAAYQAAEWTMPAHPDTALRAAASRTGWLDTSDTKAVKVVWKGENYIQTKMPSEPKKKSS